MKKQHLSLAADWALTMVVSVSVRLIRLLHQRFFRATCGISVCIRKHSWQYIFLRCGGTQDIHIDIDIFRSQDILTVVSLELMEDLNKHVV